ncbi:hypothetical protein NQ318_023429 [Aromia moschata]|uniref:Uncharacterized protein n=1 Tax=Aromia moschata TaxID=1265417 RepID=A0AAV8YTP2_9CUCU|nr:hypothetical protein NQ318_023429 [Aromia moschata]
MLNTAWRKVSGNTIAICFRHAGLIAKTEFTEEDELLLERLQEEGRDLTQWAQLSRIIFLTLTIPICGKVAEYSDDLQIVQSIMNPPRDEDEDR